MTDKDILLTNLLNEIIDYANTNNQYSYYELKAYMITDKPEWEPAFNDKYTRSALSLYLKCARKKTGIKVKPMIDSVKILREAISEK